MPTRLLRDWTDSMRFDGITAEAERLFVRLIMKADDYGRFHADSRLIRGACFPLAENLRTNELDRWLDELSRRQLILRYEAGTRKLLAIANYGQRLKQSRPKFPPPPGMPDEWLPESDGFREVPGSSGNIPSDSDAYSETHSDAETETDAHSDAAPPCPQRGKGRFAPPTPEEVGLQCAKIGLPESEGAKFLAYYGANGWRVGRNPMRSWPHALTNWKNHWTERNANHHHQRNGNQSGPRGFEVPAPHNLTERLARAGAGLDEFPDAGTPGAGGPALDQ